MNFWMLGIGLTVFLAGGAMVVWLFATLFRNAPANARPWYLAIATVVGFGMVAGGIILVYSQVARPNFIPGGGSHSNSPTGPPTSTTTRDQRQS